MPTPTATHTSQAPQRPQHGPPKAAVALASAPAQAPAIRVAAPALAAPPAAATPWASVRNPSPQIVQQQYVDLRLEEMEANRKPGRKAALQVIEQYLLDKLDPLKKHKKIPFKQLMRVYEAVERNLQSADLTINFEADTWFTNENPFDTYTQMYERAVKGGQMVLRSTGMNNADARAEVDNQITFPDTWQNAHSAAQRGLAPGRQGADRIMRQMDTGKLVPKPGERNAYHAGNQNFNPQTKQIFLGLNYGRRPHGSAMNFGRSYFVFKSFLKSRCLFYAGDTFMQRGQGTHAGGLQFSYDNLGALLGGEQPGALLFRADILKSCYEGQALTDPMDTGMCKFYLLEAHHFGELNFRDYAEYMVISPTAVSDKNVWPQIVENARKFASRQGIKLYQTA